MKIGNFVSNVGLSVIAVVILLFSLEGGIRVYKQVRSPALISKPTEQKQAEPINVIYDDSPVLYGLNPKHPDVNSQYLRGVEVAIPKPDNIQRILVLGDSVTYGLFLPKEHAFPDRLEALFNDTEVLNAGVIGYSTYNELQFYLHRGRTLQPDRVILGFVFNDIANPRLHLSESIDIDFPAESIPNPVYDATHVLPMFKEKLWKMGKGPIPSVLYHSALYKFIKKRFDSLQHTYWIRANKYVVGEDPTLSIEVLLDESSQEWKWLTATFDQLHDATEADGIEFIIVIFPLAYQLNKAYPYLPQKNLITYCKRNLIPCLDLLPAFRQHAPEKIFFLDKSGFYDIWHLTTFGHELTANVLFNFLEKNKPAN